MRAHSRHDAAKQIVGSRGAVVQPPARRALAVDVVEGEIEDALLHLCGDLALFRKLKRAVDGVEAELARLAEVAIPVSVSVPAMERSARVRSFAFTGTRFAHFGHRFAVGASRGMHANRRESTQGAGIFQAVCLPDGELHLRHRHAGLVCRALHFDDPRPRCPVSSEAERIAKSVGAECTAFRIERDGVEATAASLQGEPIKVELLWKALIRVVEAIETPSAHIR